MSNNKTVFPGTSHVDQLHLIGECLGKSFQLPTGESDYSEQLVVIKNAGQIAPGKSLHDRFKDYLSPSALNLLEQLLTFEMSQRITAKQALEHMFFSEEPISNVDLDMEEAMESDKCDASDEINNSMITDVDECLDVIRDCDER